MSFYSNFQSDKCPGSVTGNPLNGLAEKVCIQVEKIFDACIQQRQIENYTLTLTDLTPADPTYPLTFVSARSLSAEATVSGLSIERQADKQCARVQATVSIPVDVLLFVPAPSIIPFTVKAVVSVVAPDGTYDTETQGFVVSLCATVILKISMPVELLVPTYGYCVLPPAQEYSQEVCSGFFELPLYPQSHRGGCKNCNNTCNN